MPGCAAGPADDHALIIADKDVALCPATSDNRAYVIPACHCSTMQKMRRLRGIELR